MVTISAEGKGENTTTKKAVEDDVRDLIQRELMPAAKPGASASAQQPSPPLAPSFQSAGATTIDAIERLISELQETREYLKNEGDRIARATERYEKMTQNAAASVEIISDTIHRWRKSGFS
ncbi:MAG: hypothetical protein J0H17_05535 [Rhizobiales bacterium]|jgi:hypothetical protein|nr:hypothetical protein [Hyphomicrobiales bacterium]